MKNASELKIPFTWEERRPVLLESFLYIPKCYAGHEEWKVLPWSDLFGNGNPVSIEFCSGNGAWIAERAKQHRDRNWVAVEQRFDRARKIWARKGREELFNLFVVCGEGLLYSSFYVPQQSVEEVFVNFPDPWPKMRHAKHRLVRGLFLEAVAKVVLPGAKGTFVTDDATYAQQMLRELLQSPFWEPLLASPHFVTEWPGYGSSFFHELWLAKGRRIYYLPFQVQ